MARHPVGGTMGNLLQHLPERKHPPTMYPAAFLDVTSKRAGNQQGGVPASLRGTGLAPSAGARRPIV